MAWAVLSKACLEMSLLSVTRLVTWSWSCAEGSQETPSLASLFPPKEGETKSF